MRGNAGVRWLSTKLASTGNNIANGTVTGQTVTSSSYSFWLPRFSLVVEPADSGYRFRHALVREAVLGRMPPHDTARAHREVAERLAELGAPPVRVAHHYLAAGLPSRAVPFVLRAVETAKRNGSWEALNDVDAMPDGLIAALATDERARLHFEGFAPSTRRMILYWIKSAQRAETRARRIAETVRLAADNRPPRL